MPWATCSTNGLWYESRSAGLFVDANLHGAQASTASQVESKIVKSPDFKAQNQMASS